MANASTIVDALRTSGIATETAPVLTNPGGNNPWLFVWPAGNTANAGAPVVLSIPVVQGESPVAAEQLAGGNQATDQEWYGDRAMFLVRIVGRVQPNATAKTLKLYVFSGNGLPDSAAGAIGDKQVAFGSASISPTGGAFSNFFLEIRCLWDSSSLQLTGTYEGQIAGSLISKTAFAVYDPTAYKLQQAAGSYNPLDFVVAANVNSTANAVADLVILDEFTAEEL